METDEATPTALSPEDGQRESRRQLRVIVDALPMLVAYVEGEACYRFTNRAHREWYGYAPEEITGKSMQEVLGYAAYSIVQGHVRATLAGEQVRFEADILNVIAAENERATGIIREMRRLFCRGASRGLRMPT